MLYQSEALSHFLKYESVEEEEEEEALTVTQ